MMPSATRAASMTSGGSVEPCVLKVVRPMPCTSRSRPSLNFSLARSSTASVAFVISGPMPSPGRTSIFTASLRHRWFGEGAIVTSAFRQPRSWTRVYEGFEQFEIQTSDPEVKIVGRVGGKGPAVLLLHGNPLTHVHWHLVAPRLARDFTVVATDLRGYGDSGKPRGREDHGNYSFRRMAQDQVDVMQHLGFGQFCVAGHDRGARTAHRMA